MLPVLTNRGNELFRLVADGLTEREISCYLTSTESTVEKRGISYRAQAVTHFFRMRTSFQIDTQIEGSLHDSTSINCHDFGNFPLFGVL